MANEAAKDGRVDGWMDGSPSSFLPSGGRARAASVLNRCQRLSQSPSVSQLSERRRRP